MLIILLRCFNQHCFTFKAVLISDLIPFVAENSCLYKYGEPEKDSIATFRFVFVLKQFDNSFHEFEIIFSVFVFGSVFPFSVHFLNSINLTDKKNLLENHPSASASHAKQFYRGAYKFLARPTFRCILFDGQNISFDASLVILVYI